MIGRDEGRMTRSWPDADGRTWLKCIRRQGDEAARLDREADRLYEAGPVKVGIVCTGCGHDIGNEGLANLTDGYTECCNEPVR